MAGRFVDAHAHALKLTAAKEDSSVDRQHSWCQLAPYVAHLSLCTAEAVYEIDLIMKCPKELLMRQNASPFKNVLLYIGSSVNLGPTIIDTPQKPSFPSLRIVPTIRLYPFQQLFPLGCPYRGLLQGRARKAWVLFYRHCVS